ncbi:Sodium-coupled monocarboxylate transporter 1-like 1 [Homarus americanus]|uniref:Sodium-coupled monocarboxylate transporter 1-like 1 n=1 Tax=Homarus americanus TaxID=6706 RepID=A0A8J5NBC7_HOMAM|nr:Sodium-coupled monocarboxylate transporter 1-like 1 [Homarus americanus]
MAGFSGWDWAVFAVSLAISLGTGIWAGLVARKNTAKGDSMARASEFLMGGRNMNPIAIALSTTIGALSSITVLGDELSFEVQQELLKLVNGTLWPSISALYCKVRHLSRPSPLHTFASRVYVPIDDQGETLLRYIERRFKSKNLRAFTVYTTFIGTFFFMGLCAYTPSLAMETITGIPSWASVIVLGVTCTIYSSWPVTPAYYPCLLPQPTTQAYFLSLLPQPVTPACYPSLLPQPVTPACYPSLLPHPATLLPQPVTLLPHLLPQPVTPAPPCDPCLLPQPATPSCYPSLLPQPVTPACYPSLLPQPTTQAYFLSLLPQPVTPACYPILLPQPSTPVTPACYPSLLSQPTTQTLFPQPATPACDPCLLPQPATPASYLSLCYPSLPSSPTPSCYPSLLPQPVTPACYPILLPQPSTPACYPSLLIRGLPQGGVRAVVYTDIFQSFVMMGGLLFIAVTATIETGGLEKVWSIADAHGRVEWWNINPDPLQRESFWLVTVQGYFLSLLVLGMGQPQVQRVCSVSSWKRAISTHYLNMVLFIAVYSCCYFMGIAVFSVYADCDPMATGDISTPDQIIPYYTIDKLSVYYGLPGIFIASFSYSAQINAVSAVLWEDFFKNSNWVANMAEERRPNVNVLVSVITGTVGIVAGIIASQLGGIFQMGQTILGTIHAPLLGLFILGMCCPFANKIGGTVGFVTSLTFNLWVTCGTMVYGRPPKTLDFSDAGCNVTTTTMDALTTYPDFHTTDLPSTTPDPGNDYVFPLYLVSYTLYALFGVSITFFVGSIVSLIFKPWSTDVTGKDLVHKTFYNLMRKWEKRYTPEDPAASSKNLVPLEKY